jgi:hypothetical protein
MKTDTIKPWNTAPREISPHSLGSVIKRRATAKLPASGFQGQPASANPCLREGMTCSYVGPLTSFFVPSFQICNGWMVGLHSVGATRFSDIFFRSCKGPFKRDSFKSQCLPPHCHSSCSSCTHPERHLAPITA